MIDRDLGHYDSDLFGRVEIIPGLDARLALIDPRTSQDKYCVLQGLADKNVEDAYPNRCYAYRRFGATGTRGEIKIDGPMTHPKVASILARVFKEKTGKAWGTVKPGDAAEPGKYWLQQQAAPDGHAKWQYYVSDGVDGKRTGWYPYEEQAS